jgi:hypothetical protein
MNSHQLLSPVLAAMGVRQRFARRLPAGREAVSRRPVIGMEHGPCFSHSDFEAFADQAPPFDQLEVNSRSEISR